MANTTKHKIIGRLRAGLSPNKKEELYIKRIDNRHNFFDDRDKKHNERLNGRIKIIPHKPLNNAQTVRSSIQ